jgi:hypothetical protein
MTQGASFASRRHAVNLLIRGNPTVGRILTSYMASKTKLKPALPSGGHPLPERESRSLRRASQLNLPLPAAQRWVAALPGEIEPRALLQQFPRIANKLARLWGDRDSLEKYLNDLLISRRGTRQGFPPDVQNELLNLRDYVEGRNGNLPPP